MTPRTHITPNQFRSLFSFTVLPQSWRKHLGLLRNERFQPYFVAAFTLWLVGAVEIIQKTGGQKLDPRFWMLVAVLITVYSGLRIFRLTPKASPVSSRTVPPPVSDMVNRMRSNGVAVCENATDENRGAYVLVTPAGIYAMEVKARNVFGSRTIEYRRDNELVLGGRIADSRPMKQAQAAAQKIRERLGAVLQTGTVVKPLVVFLNDWRINRASAQHEVDVLNEHEIQHYLQTQKPVLSESDVTEISTYLNGPEFAAAC
jgi:hypothetical protein